MVPHNCIALIPIARVFKHNCGVQIILIKFKNSKSVWTGTLVPEVFLEFFCLGEL